jgi:hypothetical protein
LNVVTPVFGGSRFEGLFQFLRAISAATSPLTDELRQSLEVCRPLVTQRPGIEIPVCDANRFIASPWISRTVMRRAHIETILSWKAVVLRDEPRLETALAVARKIDAHGAVLG